MKIRHRLPIYLCMLLAASLLPRTAFSDEPPENPVKHVILISIDGLRPDALTALGPRGLPNFYTLIAEGASTLNARTDPDFTNTLPNHTSMITGRPVKGAAGHAYDINKTTERNVHEIKGEYVPSMFDVAHNAGMTTAALAAKSKFAVFAMSWADHLIKLKKKPRIAGSRSIDTFQYTEANDEALIDFWETAYPQNRPALIFLHLGGPDNVGHTFGWNTKEGSLYLKQIIRDDRLIGRVLQLIRKDPQLSKSTVVILTADHGGSGLNHHDARARLNYTIPFIIWGTGVTAGTELYALNKDIRRDPGDRQFPVDPDTLQPIRNGDAANLALSLLGLPAIPGSVINAGQDLKF